MVDFQIPLSGMNRASASVDKTAVRIAAAPVATGDSLDLSDDMVALLTAKNDFAANVKVAQTMDQMSKSLLDVLG